MNAFKVDEVVKSWKCPIMVIPAKAGIQQVQALIDSHFRGSDVQNDFLRDYQS